MPPQIEMLTRQVAQEKARRQAARQRRAVAWEPKPIWLWLSFWVFARRDPAAPDGLDLDLGGWQAMLRTLAEAGSDDAALDALLAWADTAYCGGLTACTADNLTGPAWQGPSAYAFVRDVVQEHRRRVGDRRNVSWLPDADVEHEGRALLLADLAADRASGELLRPDPWERFFDGEERP